MIEEEVMDLVSVIMDGGMYYFNHDSRVVLIADDFTGLDKMTTPLMQIAIKTGCTFLGAHVDKKTYNESSLKKAVDMFLRMNHDPSFLFCVRVYPGLIMDNEICLVKDAMIDHDGLLKKIMSVGLEWFKVKDEETGSDTTKTINECIQREWKILGATLIVSENAMGYLSDLVSRLPKNNYEIANVI